MAVMLNSILGIGLRQWLFQQLQAVSQQKEQEPQQHKWRGVSCTGNGMLVLTLPEGHGADGDELADLGRLRK